MLPTYYIGHQPIQLIIRVFHLLAQPDWQLLLLLLIQRSQSQPAKRKTIKQQNTMSPKNQIT